MAPGWQVSVRKGQEARSPRCQSRPTPRSSGGRRKWGASSDMRPGDNLRSPASPARQNINFCQLPPTPPRTPCPAHSPLPGVLREGRSENSERTLLTFSGSHPWKLLLDLAPPQNRKTTVASRSRVIVHCLRKRPWLDSLGSRGHAHVIQNGANQHPPQRRRVSSGITGEKSRGRSRVSSDRVLTSPAKQQEGFSPPGPATCWPLLPPWSLFLRGSCLGVAAAYFIQVSYNLEAVYCLLGLCFSFNFSFHSFFNLILRILKYIEYFHPFFHFSCRLFSSLPIVL